MITWPTKENLVQRYLAWHRYFFPNTSTAERSDAWLEAQGVGGVAGLVLARVRAVYNDMFPDTATGDAIDRHMFVCMPASKRRQAASGTTGGDVTATGVATAIPANTEFVHADGTRYRNATAVGVAEWAGGSVTFDVTSIDTGVGCNKASGDTLTFISPIAGIDDEVTVNTDLSGARDRESDDEAQARLLDWLRYPPGGGNWAHYKAYAEGVGSCVIAFIYEGNDSVGRGLGTVDVVCLGPGRSEDAYVGARFSADQNLVWDELTEEVRPCTADLDTRPSLGGLGVSDPVAQAENVQIVVTPVTGYGPDFVPTYATVGMPDAYTVNLVALPAAISQGDRVLLNVQAGGIYYPEVREVASTGVNFITVTEPFSATTPGATLYPAGPGTLTQVEAILDLFDTLTPGDTTPATRKPVISSDHPTDLLLADIFDAVQGLASVQNMTITTPVADVTPGAAKQLIRNGLIVVTYI